MMDFSFRRFPHGKDNKPEMVNAQEGLNKVILRKIKRFDCKTIRYQELASS